MTGDPVFITAQEAAERIQTIKTAGWVLFSVAVLGFILLLCAMRKKEKEKQAEIDARNAEIEAEKYRIESTERIGIAMAEAMKTDSYWKAKFTEIAKENVSLKEENEGLKSTMEMVGIKDIAEFREWLKTRKEAA
jgi:hypothetical protein